jgi:predicted TPR repeat methyltransferase
MTTVAALMSSAWQHHQAGNLSAAENLYRQVLQSEPNHADAIYLLALVCHVQGRTADSSTLYEQYLRLKPEVAEIHNALGVSYAAQGRLTEAVACYRRAVQLKPDLAEAFNNLGYLLTMQKDWDQAAAALRRALDLKPNYPEALNNLGIVLFQQQRPAEAETLFRQAITLRPQYPEALGNLGGALLGQGKNAEAADCYRQVLRLRPNDARTYNNLGAICRNLNQLDEAENCLKRSLALNPGDAITLRNLANLYQDRSKYAEALPCFRQLLVLNPKDVEVRLLVEALSGTSTLKRMPADYLAGQYDAGADSFEKDWVRRLGYNSPELLMASLGSAPAPRSLDILDLGCGTGLCGLHFKDWARTLTGVDISAGMQARARQRGVYTELIRGDMVTAVLERHDAFNLALASDVLLHFGDLAPVLQAVRQALRPGGRFAFTVDLLQPPNGADYKLMPYLHFAHSRDYLRRAAAEAGLEIVRMDDVLFPREVGVKVAGLVLVLARPSGA